MVGRNGTKSDKLDGAVEALERQRVVQLELVLSVAARVRRIRQARVEALRADLRADGWGPPWGRPAVMWCYVVGENIENVD